MRRKLLKILTSIVVCFCFVTPRGYAAEVKMADLIVSDVRLSNQYYKVGDIIDVYVDVTNIGTAATETTGWSGMSTIKGLDRKSDAAWVRPSIYPGQTVTWCFPKFVVTDEEIEIQGMCNTGKNITETNTGNNLKIVSFSPIKIKKDIAVTDISPVRENFKPGETLAFNIEITNIGVEDIDYSTIGIELTAGGETKRFKSVHSLASRQKLTIKSPEFTVNGNTVDVKAYAEIKGFNDEKPDNNELSKVISSVASAEYNWDTIRIGGGGVIAGCDIHPVYPDIMYARGDVSGAWKWLPGTRSWKSVTSWITPEQDNMHFGCGIAFDWNDKNAVYMALGGNVNGFEGEYEASGLYRSYDGGESWEDMKIPAEFNKNIGYRTSNIMAVDPNNSNILYCGSTTDGLYRTNNATGAVPVWERVNLSGWNFNAESTDGSNGVCCIVFDKNKTIDGKTAKIYVSALANGVYCSEDGGKTFSLMNNSPKILKNLVLAENGTLFAANNFDNGEIYKYKDGEWKIISPYEKREYSIDVNPFNSDMLISSSTNDIFLSFDGGDSWENISKAKNKGFTVPWWPASYFANHMTWAKFDPHHKNRVYFGDWFGQWTADDITKGVDAKWASDIFGYEEFCIREMCAAPSGARLFVGANDNDSVRMEKIFEYPETKMNTPWMQDCTGIDFCESDPNILVRVGGEGWGSKAGNGAYSLDNGLSFTEFEDYPLDEDGKRKNHGRVVVASGKNDDGVATIVTIPLWSVPYRSADYGKTWTPIDTLPSDGIERFMHTTRPMAADKVNKDVFYYYDYKTGDFYISKNNAQTFAKSASLPKGCYQSYVWTAPGKEGNVYVSINYEGIYFSSDYGNTFRKIDNVTQAFLFALGKEAENSEYPTMYIFGSVNNNEGVFRSTDNGESWVKINNAQTGLGNIPQIMVADRQQFGIVYIGTQGTGAYVGMPAELDIIPPRIAIKDDLDGAVIKEGVYKLTGASSEKATITCTLNGVQGSVQTDENNEFSIDLSLADGKNSLILEAEDPSGNKTSTKMYEFTHDKNYISVSFDRSDGIFQGDKLEITGSVSSLNKDNTVTINGKPLKVNINTREFSFTADIKNGDNVFKATAFDDLGNTAEKVLTVTKDIEPPELIFKNLKNIADEPLLLLEGRASEPVNINVAGNITQLLDKENLNFEIPVSLENGDNTVEIFVSDIAGNTASYKKVINFIPNDKFPKSKSDVIAYSGTAVLDGNLDEFELNRVLGKLYEGSSKAFGKYGLLADDTYLYVGAEIHDSRIYPLKQSVTPSHLADSLELFFDANNDKADTYGSDDKQIRIDLYGQLYDCQLRRLMTEGQSKITMTDFGYIAEIAIPWSYINVNYGEGNSFGFDISINDNITGSEERAGVIGWVGNSIGYRDTTGFGNAYIISK